MRKKIFSIILIVGLTTAAYAQDYDTGIGLRGGYGWGLTLKHFISPKNAVEGFFYAYPKGFNVTGLYQFHFTAFDVDYLRWYCGFGGHIGSYTYRYWDIINGYRDKTDFVIGVDGILGIEYTFTEAPINIGLDWNPHINFTGNTGFLPGFGAIAVRYTF